jgi:hypothetical protein
VIAAVRRLVLIANDDLIAGILNRNGLVTGYGNRWTRERVTSLRSYYGIAVYKLADDGIEPWLNLNNAARLLRWRLKHSGLRRKLVRSKHSTLCRTVPGSSAVPFSPQRRRVPSPNAHARTQGTPQDRIPISNACSLQ